MPEPSTYVFITMSVHLPYDVQESFRRTLADIRALPVGPA